MDILSSITDYFEFLEKNYSLFVSVHCLKPPLNSFIQKLGKYNSHYHPFCMYIKSHRELYKKCLSMQSKVISKNEKDIFFGECIFGVSEYVVPIVFEDENIGFVSVSGFCSDEDHDEKIRRLGEKHQIDKDELLGISKSLSRTPPDRNFVRAVLSHIALSLSLYAEALPKNETGNNRTNYIYTNALAYIHEHFKEQISVDEIADFCNCSRSYITKLFKANGDNSIKSYITDLRMTEAKRLLKRKDRSIKEIAFFLGYNDSNYFSNAFRKNTGVYPREYRIKHNIE